ncbi:hypothetical protein L6R52_43195, partial [Myxococcota bacterium]|nr:hypothetical protein [Myxococcota bacterium]
TARHKADEGAAALTEAVELARRGEDAELEVRALVELGGAHAAAGRADLALIALSEARRLDPSAVPEPRLERAIEAAGPSERLAQLLEARGRAERDVARRARLFRDAAAMWESLGDVARAIEPKLEAYRAEPGGRSEARELEEQLFAAERWADLDVLFAKRLEVEELTPADRASVLVARARVASVQLGRKADALAWLVQARDLAPKSREVLGALASAAAEAGDDDVRQETLGRLVAQTKTPAERLALLSERAEVLERQGELAGAVQCLEDAVDLALATRRDDPAVPPDEAGAERLAVRELAERLGAIYARRGHWASCARLWVRVADGASGNEAAAALSRAGHIRLEALGDRRGAMAALEAAARQAPADLGLRRALLELATALGDLGKARTHVRAAIDAAKQAEEPDAWLAFLLEEARIAAALGDKGGAIAALGALVELRPDYPRLAEHLIARVKDAGDAERVISLLRKKIAELGPGAVRVRLRAAIARLLDDPLGRIAEAENERRGMEREDLEALAPSERQLPELTFLSLSKDGGREVLEEYRTQRSVLDRSGRWSELAGLEEKRAAVLADPIARSQALVEVGRLHVEKREEATATGSIRPRATDDRIARGRDAFVRALRAYPDNVDALARLARLEIDAESWAQAEAAIERLERLGGPAWAISDFELAAADVALAMGRTHVAAARLVRARERDPGSRAALARLATLGATKTVGAIDGASDLAPAIARWQEEWERALDRMRHPRALFEL